ncbi:MAG: hypothetical protein DLM53_00240 [Candidatus Eremiobacter antarcticus]|nr:MAG: hypothetical protein DLM53_00240 [Candidatus Eremiobacter sp. RRmetagenome_bin22]
MKHHPFKSAHIRKAWLRKQLGQYGPFCWLCGYLLPDAFGLSEDGIWATTFDHVQTRADGGTSDYENLRLAHGKCNYRRNNRCVTTELIEHIHDLVPGNIRRLSSRLDQ